jgi:hypothetical protein
VVSGVPHHSPLTTHHFSSDPGTIRTFDPQLRRLLLYPLSYGAKMKREDNKRFWILDFGFWILELQMLLNFNFLE